MTTTTMLTREDQIRRALFRGDDLVLGNPAYLRVVQALLGELLASDLGAGDLTAGALQVEERGASAAVYSKEPGVVAGLAEFGWLYARGGIRVRAHKTDGDLVSKGETLAEIEARRGDLLAYERTGLNLLQRMCGIATATRNLQELAHRHNRGTEVVATRKTPWGLLDKRAVHLGGGGTHRLGLWDAILVKNNHLALLAEGEEEAAAMAARRAWKLRATAAFIEVEVRSRESAVAAARAFAELRRGLGSERGGSERGGEDADACPCLLLLDNMDPAQVSAIRDGLRSASLLDFVLLEASGNISEENLEAYASTGMDAVSIGALTHSARALDISQRAFHRPASAP